MFSYSNSDEIIEYYFNNNNFFNEKTKNEKENEKKTLKSKSKILMIMNQFTINFITTKKKKLNQLLMKY